MTTKPTINHNTIVSPNFIIQSNFHVLNEILFSQVYNEDDIGLFNKPIGMWRIKYKDQKQAA